jgi:hypothetical protein
VDHGTDLRGVALESHYLLCEHYSSLVFRARIANMTLIVVVGAFVIGLRDQSASGTLIDWELMRSSVALVGATVIALLHLMELGYARRFYQVMVAGRTLERQAGVSGYFNMYDRSESWPLNAIYGIVVAVLAVSPVAVLWHRMDVVGLLAVAGLGAVPTALFGLAAFKTRHDFRESFSGAWPLAESSDASPPTGGPRGQEPKQGS